MKINYFAKARILFSASVVCALLSCSNETDEIGVMANEADQYSAEILEKIAYGCDSYLYDEDVDEKIETSASDEYMALIIERLSHFRANKGATVSDGEAPLVGVIKVGPNCGKYKEAEIYYDCEDGNNCTTSSGFIGQWQVLHNITMRFCLVPATLFFNNDMEYGVINFSDLSYSYVTNGKRGHDMLRFIRYRVHMDAEDNGSLTKIWRYEGDKRTKVDRYGSVEVDKNGNLEFDLLINECAHDYNSTTSMMPNLGMEYGVFGITSANEGDLGRVYSDDENRNNANYMYRDYYESYDIRKDNPYTDIIDMGKNTEFKMTRVQQKYQLQKK